MAYSFQKFEYTRFFALNGDIHVHSLRHIMMTLWAKTETIAAGVERVKISANPDNLITKIFLAI